MSIPRAPHHPRLIRTYRTHLNPAPDCLAVPELPCRVTEFEYGGLRITCSRYDTEPLWSADAITSMRTGTTLTHRPIGQRACTLPTGDIPEHPEPDSLSLLAWLNQQTADTREHA